MRIRLIGQRNSTGIGTHYACFADHLKRQQSEFFTVQEIDFQNAEVLQQAIDTSAPDDVNICFVGSNIHQHFRGKNIQWTVFETDLIPEILRPCLLGADEIWVPSTWGQNVLIQNGFQSHQIQVVPEGVDAQDFQQAQIKPTGNRPFRFLTISKYERRKGIDETLETFAQTFGNRSDVELIVKSHYPGNALVNADDKFQQLQQKILQLNVNNIRLLWGEMARSDLVQLYGQCDVFVLPTRGEGWGLPIIEAAAMGLPIVSTMWGGQVEFLSHIVSSVLVVDSEIVPVDCDEFKKYYPGQQWGNWARPRISSLQQCMIRAWQDRNLLNRLAVSNSDTIRTKFGWNHSVDRALGLLFGGKYQQNQ